MIRTLFSIMIFICIPVISFSQDYTFDPDKKTKTDKEVYNEGKTKYSRVLLIPYKPVMHLPDPAGDVELAQHSQKGIMDIRKQLRWALDFSVSEKIKSLYKIMPLLRAQTEGGQNDLDRIYGSVSYKYEERVIKEDETSKPTLDPKQLFDRKKEDSEKSQAGIVDGQIVAEVANREKKYMNAVIKDEKLLSYLSDKYGADLFVFINQFEIKKTFAQGSDVAYGNYERDVKVHYTIFDQDGNQLWGDVAVSHISSKTDDIDEIMKIAFPSISDVLLSNLPGAGKSQEDIKMDKEYRKKAEEQDLVRPH
ncbi:MAG: hypothetical protein ABII90_12940 [Bacteroidota bacterium]